MTSQHAVELCSLQLQLYRQPPEIVEKTSAVCSEHFQTLVSRTGAKTCRSSYFCSIITGSASRLAASAAGPCRLCIRARDFTLLCNELRRHDTQEVSEWTTPDCVALLRSPSSLSAFRLKDCLLTLLCWPHIQYIGSCPADGTERHQPRRCWSRCPSPGLPDSHSRYRSQSCFRSVKFGMQLKFSCL